MKTKKKIQQKKGVHKKASRARALGGAVSKINSRSDRGIRLGEGESIQVYSFLLNEAMRQQRSWGLDTQIFKMAQSFAVPTVKFAEAKSQAKLNPLRIGRGVESETSSSAAETRAYVYVLASHENLQAELRELLRLHLSDENQVERFLKLEQNPLFVQGKSGPVWFVSDIEQSGSTDIGGARMEKVSAYGSLRAVKQNYFAPSGFCRMRDFAGIIMTGLRGFSFDFLQLEFKGSVPHDSARGFLLGLELSSYQFKDYLMIQRKKHFDLSVKGVSGAVFLEALYLGVATNFARHLTNLPANILSTRAFVREAERIFKKHRRVEVEVWHHERLGKEGMGLHKAVGEGSRFGSSLIRLFYRSADLKKKRNKLKLTKGDQSNAAGLKAGSFGNVNERSLVDLAFVGKGVVFDTGGNDIKDSRSMRLMKKDMGGAASVFGLSLWLSLSKCVGAVDFYLPLSENSVDAFSMRPGDLYQARNGKWVEIHNTDAEGRLLLADSLALAVESGANRIIDVATLTGAIKAGLGSQIAGLFSNDDDLEKLLIEHSKKAGELLWPMPLFGGYKGMLASGFADISSASDGFGGAITAALFLEGFVQDRPWAHLDIYAWSDKAHGCLGVGGSGQGVQLLASMLEDLGSQIK